MDEKIKPNFTLYLYQDKHMPKNHFEKNHHQKLGRMVAKIKNAQKQAKIVRKNLGRVFPQRDN